MGHVYQRVKLAAVNEEDLNILVDTGATLSLMPPVLADRLGIARFPRKHEIVLADGRRIDAEVGVVMVEIGDRKAPSTVVIADCDEPRPDGRPRASIPLRGRLRGGVDREPH